ncbi:MAG: Dabb family protein [Pseudomonadota bacterium]
MPDRSFIRHVVFFTAKDRADLARIIDGLSLLKDIPQAALVEVSENKRVDQIANEIDAVVYAEFPDEAALEAYKAHPNYQRAIDIVRPLRDIRHAVDF